METKNATASEPASYEWAFSGLTPFSVLGAASVLATVVTALVGNNGLSASWTHSGLRRC